MRKKARVLGAERKKMDEKKEIKGQFRFDQDSKRFHRCKIETERAAIKYSIVDIAFDQFNSAHLVQELIAEGLTMTSISQRKNNLL